MNNFNLLFTLEHEVLARSINYFVTVLLLVVGFAVFLKFEKSSELHHDSSSRRRSLNIVHVVALGFSVYLRFPQIRHIAYIAS